jgi:hypothetical protein
MCHGEPQSGFHPAPLIDATNKAFSQVLIGVWDYHCSARDRAFENVMRAGDPNKCPSLPLKAANDIAAVGQHGAPPSSSHMMED